MSVHTPSLSGGIQPGLQDGARVGVLVEFVVGEEPEHGLGVVGWGECGRGRVQPVGGVVLVADPREFERVEGGERLDDRGARGVRVRGEVEQCGDPPVLVVVFQEADRGVEVGAFAETPETGIGRCGDDGGLFQWW
jgi:hypothetical protein